MQNVMKNVMAQSIPSVPILPRAFVILEKLQMPHVGAGRFVQPLACVASISSRVRRESWDESKKNERTGEGEGTRLETKQFANASPPGPATPKFHFPVYDNVKLHTVFSRLNAGPRLNAGLV